MQRSMDQVAAKLAVDGGIPIRTAPFPSWPIWGNEEERLILEVVRSGQWGATLGKIKLQQLEDEFAAMHDAKYAITVANGTLGLTVAMQAAGVTAGDEVIMPPYTFIATASAALIFGAIPVFVDVLPESLLIDPDKVEAAITPKTKAIIAVHIAGEPANLPRLKQIADKHGLRLIEDACQAIGAELDGTPIGAVGDFGIFSFQAGKNITAGEGGIILTNNGELFDRVWSLANVGRIRKGGWYQHELIGWNLRMTEFQAAILLAQLSRLEVQFERRETNARLLDRLLGEVEGIRTMPANPRVNRHARHFYMFAIDSAWLDRVEKADVIRMLQAEGIPVTDGYVSLNENKAVIAEIEKWTGTCRPDRCPVSERACKQEVLWLRQNVLLADEQDMHEIALAVQKVMSILANSAKEVGEREGTDRHK